jgi:23S rRNA pseudouridine955/2504/2580 synthase
MDNSIVQLIEIDENSAGQRVDNFLVKILKGVPKSRIYRLLRKGEVRLNKGRIKASVKLQLGDTLRVPPIRTSSDDEPETARRWLLDALNNSIIFEDARLLIINKPTGIAVHGGSGVSIGVIEAFRQMRPEQKGLELIHRLDRDTSGCLMIAKKRSCLRNIQALLANKTKLEKHYKAIVHGKWPRRKQHVDLPLQKNTLKSGERISTVSAEGKSALTRVAVIEQSSSYSLLSLQPITGRTHQLRVHCQHPGFPIVGDEKYGNEEKDAVLKGAGFRRLMLHAEKLVIPPLEPGDKAIEVVAPIDLSFKAMIENIK